MNNTIISVIVPCYNQSQYLTECIQSILEQTHLNWECIIVNDGSPDDTTEVSKKLCALDSRIRYIEKTNGGLASARNAGIEKAIGKYILPLDADDRIGQRYLEEAIEVFETQEGVSLVYSEAQKFGAVTEFWKLAEYRYESLLQFNMIFCSAVYLKSDWARIGGYDESMRRAWEDWEFWIRLLDKNSIVVKLRSTHFYYRMKEQSMITSMTHTGFEEIRWYIFLKHLPKYKTYLPSPIFLALENERLQIENESLKNNLANVLTSTSYKVGNKMVSRLAFLKDLQPKK
jgi:glycosyltransferase involved in cell wall biosynthesis